MTAMPGAATTFYRLLVYLYPPAFRREFASEMAYDFEEATRDAWHVGRWPAVVTLWASVCRDLAVTVAAQWLRHGPHIVTVLSALSTTVCWFVAAGLLWRPPQPIARHPRDEDELVMLFLATMVVVLAAAVIMFTVSFRLMVLRRSGRARRV